MGMARIYIVFDEIYNIELILNFNIIFCLFFLRSVLEGYFDTMNILKIKKVYLLSGDHTCTGEGYSEYGNINDFENNIFYYDYTGYLLFIITKDSIKSHF